MTSQTVLRYLISPRPAAEHLRALEARGHTAGSEGSTTWKQTHIDTLPEIDQDQTVIQVLLVKVLVVQEPTAMWTQNFMLF